MSLIIVNPHFKGPLSRCLCLTCYNMIRSNAPQKEVHEEYTCPFGDVLARTDKLVELTADYRDVVASKFCDPHPSNGDKGCSFSHWLLEERCCHIRDVILNCERLVAQFKRYQSFIEDQKRMHTSSEASDEDGGDDEGEGDDVVVLRPLVVESRTQLDEPGVKSPSDVEYTDPDTDDDAPQLLEVSNRPRTCEDVITECKRMAPHILDVYRITSEVNISSLIDYDVVLYELEANRRKHIRSFFMCDDHVDMSILLKDRGDLVSYICGNGNCVAKTRSIKYLACVHDVDASQSTFPCYAQDVVKSVTKWQILMFCPFAFSCGHESKKCFPLTNTPTFTVGHLGRKSQ